MDLEQFEHFFTSCRTVCNLAFIAILTGNVLNGSLTFAKLNFAASASGGQAKMGGSVDENVMRDRKK